MGSGGREHALAWKLSQEATVVCTPGNPGIAEECDTFDVPAHDGHGVLQLAKDHGVDLVVVGPEDPLVAGLSDVLSEAGIAVFGPGAPGARHEGSKAWSKGQMSLAGVPTARAEIFTDFAAAADYASSRFDAGWQVVVKASGAALGKGVAVCGSREEALAALEDMLVHGRLGTAGKTVVVEDRLTGREFSVLTIVSGRHFWSLPVAQDYKRIHEDDLGPNTGGMGSYSPVAWLDQRTVQLAEDTIVAPMVRHMAESGIQYRGVLFSGVMVQDGKPYCLEYNVRFGDPETQSVMMLLGPGLAESLREAARGLGTPPVPVLTGAAVSVVAASAGYPGEYRKGVPVHIGAMPAGAKAFHAGTKRQDGQLVTSGGRVLAVSAYAPDLTTARKAAYEGLANVDFEGMVWRRDIAASPPDGATPEE